MKNIKIKFGIAKYILSATSIIGLLGSLVIVSCSDVEADAKGEFAIEKYYQNRDQAYAALVGTYDVLRKNSGGFENMITMMNAGSDDQYAGGGNASDGAGIQGFSNFTLDAYKIPQSFWNDHYQGISRANLLLNKLPGVPMSDTEKKQFAAEAKTLRALYYFNLLRMFKNIPLILEPIASNDEFYKHPQVSPDKVYSQIESDLTSAIADLPVNPVATGRLGQGAAKALLGKVYLYEGKNALAVAQLAEVNGNPVGTSTYGYRLVENFADLWDPSKKFNSESILEVAHNDKGNTQWGNWGSGSDEGNSVSVMVGPRSFSLLDPTKSNDVNSGWAFNVFTEDFYNFMMLEPTDKRISSTIYDAKSLVANGVISYSPAYKDTGYFFAKFFPWKKNTSVGSSVPELNYSQDTYVIRLADTYLMEAEALGGTGARAQALLDAVRTRAGLSLVPVSMTAIKNERRRELAGEGHRFFDLVRWGDAATVLASRGFVAGKNEIFPIPYKDLENTVLKQNPNY